MDTRHTALNRLRTKNSYEKGSFDFRIGEVLRYPLKHEFSFIPSVKRIRTESLGGVYFGMGLENTIPTNYPELAGKQKKPTPTNNKG